MRIDSPRFLSLLSFAFLAAVALGGAAGCGSDDDEGASCSSVASKLCQAACDCGGAAGCAIGDETSSITFDNKADCLQLYSLGCQQPSDSIDFKACADALATPTCVQGTDGMVLKAPAACEE